MDLEHDPEREAAQRLVNRGTEIAGNVAGAAAGLLLAGPPGAVAGAVAGPLVAEVLRRVGAELEQRVLGPREQARVGATLNFAAAKIATNLEAGFQVRDDGFFEEGQTERSAAQEIAEGVLLAAQREHEERKLMAYGNLLASIAFDRAISRETANLLIRVASVLSYRQLCILRLLALRPIHIGGPGPPLEENPNVSPDLLNELNDLVQSGLAGSEEVAWFNVQGSKPLDLTFMELGAMLHDLMELSELGMEDAVDSLADAFWSADEEGPAA